MASTQQQKKNKENFQEVIARSTPQEVTEFDTEMRHQGWKDQDQRVSCPPQLSRRTKCATGEYKPRELADRGVLWLQFKAQILILHPEQDIRVSHMMNKNSTKKNKSKDKEGKISESCR